MAMANFLNPQTARSPRAASPASMVKDARKPRKLILCFDGTGNKFHGNDSDSNILKIFRMLDRDAGDQFHYYQPGIGTYIISDSLSHTGLRNRINSWYKKAKDSAIGSSFDQHVVGGYRFLMRFYQSGDDIFMFGFSRGSYIARFLAEMLDFVGLLCHGNEEMVKFAWKAFAQWQARKPPPERDSAADDESKAMYDYMKGFRETFSRPVGRIRFLGLFDTVNSVPRFETAWMQRSKFPYTARTSAQVIRHAVSIDERRAKFRQDLMYQKGEHQHHHRMGEFIDRIRRSMDGASPEPPTEPAERPPERHGQFLSPDTGYAPFRSRRRNAISGTLTDDECASVSDGAVGEWRSETQDMDEVWFAGGHGDVGGGWEVPDDRKSTSHVPLTWMVREAMRAGLSFDQEALVAMGCQDSDGAPVGGGRANPAIRVQDEMGKEDTNGQLSPEEKGTRESEFRRHMHAAHTSCIHDSLEYGGGLGLVAVTAWKMMEYLPFRRMDLRHDGTWKPIRWPLPRGEVRDVPDNVRVHGSVIRRMKMDAAYRPGNLIIGGGGRGKRRAPDEYGMGEWVCVEGEGDPVGEIWVRDTPETQVAQD